MFIWPKSKPWSPGAHLSDCPGFDVLFCSPARLDRTFNETQADLIPGHFPLDQYIRLHEPDIRIMRRGEGGGMASWREKAGKPCRAIAATRF